MGDRAAGVVEGTPVALGNGTVPLGLPTGVSVGSTFGVGGGSPGLGSTGVPTGVWVGVGGRGMGDASYPLAVLGMMGEGEGGVGREGLVAGEGEGLLGAGVGAPGQR